jgi:hypothetical protein
VRSPRLAADCFDNDSARYTESRKLSNAFAPKDWAPKERAVYDWCCATPIYAYIEILLFDLDERHTVSAVFDDDYCIRNKVGRESYFDFLGVGIPRV